jgi:hypothetical protein
VAVLAAVAAAEEEAAIAAAADANTKGCSNAKRRRFSACVLSFCCAS